MQNAFRGFSYFCREAAKLKILEKTQWNRTDHFCFPSNRARSLDIMSDTKEQDDGRFPFSQNSGISGSEVTGTRFVGSSHWKIPRKSGKSKKVGPFSRLEFPKGISRSIYSFLVVCTSSRSTVRKSVGHCDVPGFTTKWNNVLPIGNSTFAPTEISRFFSQMESALNIGYLRG